MSPTAVLMRSVLLAVTVSAGLASAEVKAPASTTGGGARTTNLPVSKTLTSKRVDLGTLGGRGASVAAVDDNVVVGSSTRANGDFRAFAYDLAAETPVMRGLGTLGGRNSEATDIDGNIVVGKSELADGSSHAFAYD